MNLLDDYLNEYGITRYQLAKVSGYSEPALHKLNRSDSNSFKGRHLKAIAMMVGITPGEVLDEIIALELIDDDLNGLRKLLKDNNYRDVEAELHLKYLIETLKNDYKTTLTPFTFNRLEGEEKKLSKEEMANILDNIVKALTSAIENAKITGVPTIEVEEKIRKKNFKIVGKWWNDNEVDLVEIENEGTFALHGWNGETYGSSWKVNDNDHAEVLDGEYTITPIHSEIADYEYVITEYWIEEN